MSSRNQSSRGASSASGTSSGPAPGDSKSPVLQCEIIQALEDTWTANIFVVCFDRRDAEHNIMDLQLAYQLEQAMGVARERVGAGEVDAVVICSAKDKSFMAGADIQAQLTFVGMKGEADAYLAVKRIQNGFCCLESLPVPTIAILNGTTLGAGLELVLSCDFRIADSAHCKQLGLPEVKIGVLPGAGGCVRLPKQIGFANALQMIVAGQTVDGKTALKLGLVDELFPNSQTIAKSGSNQGGTVTYDYQWLTGVLSCMEKRRIGRKEFVVKRREGTMAAVSSVIDIGGLENMRIEDVMASEVEEFWDESEEKQKVKYPKSGSRFKRFLSLFFNAILSALTVIQVWRKVGLKMPAPLMCLLVTFRTLFARTVHESMDISARGMASLITGAESSSIMTLFLSTRKLKKCAVHFGLPSSSSKAEKFKDLGCTVAVFVSNDLLRLAVPFVQGLLHSEIPVHVVTADEVVKGSKVVDRVRELFGYSVKRGHMSKADIGERMKLLRVCGKDEKLPDVGESSSVLVVNASSQPFSLERMEEQFSKVMLVSVSPVSADVRASFPMLMNLGDPLRKNTLAVEITPLSQQVPPESLRCVSSLVSAMGKMPILTPPTPLMSCGLRLLLSHWSLAVSLVSVYGGNLSVKKVDRALVAAGYTMGPFQAMKKFGKVYVRVGSKNDNSNAYLDRLQKFIATGTIPASQRRRNLSLTEKELAELFTLNLSLSAVHACKAVPGLSEEATDALCVTNLIQFPPVEGGPLSFAARIGRGNLLSMFDMCTKAVPFLADLNGARNPRESLLSESNFGQLFDSFSKGSVDEGDKTLVELFKQQREETRLLSQRDLLKVGRTRGVENFEVFSLLGFLVLVITVLLSFVWTIVMVSWWLLL